MDSCGGTLATSEKRPDAASSVNEAAQQIAEQNGLFGNKQTDADLLGRPFG